MSSTLFHVRGLFLFQISCISFYIAKEKLRVLSLGWGCRFWGPCFFIYVKRWCPKQKERHFIWLSL